jgi:cytochrome c-type biogenesis protein
VRPFVSCAVPPKSPVCSPSSWKAGDLTVSILAALIAGALSFLSPCVLPLVPPYLCFITGTSLDDLASRETSQGRAVAAAILFVLGFTTVFVLLGATASAAGALLRAHLDLLGKIAGVAIIVMGLHFLGVFRLSLLHHELRYHGDSRLSGLVGAYVIGLAFAFGWTPCIGPVLATILSLAASEQSVAKGAGLLAVYSLGLGIPFLLSAMAVGTFLGLFQKFRKHMLLVEKAMGALLVVTGLMFLTGALQELSYWLLETFPGLVELG